MLQNAYLAAKIGADTAENERNFAEICQQKLQLPLRGRGPRRRARRRPRGAPGGGRRAADEAPGGNPQLRLVQN